MKKVLLIAFLISVTSLYAQSQATYSVTFTSNWSQANHPHSSGNLPSNAHWSRLVGATHTNQITFLEPNTLATPGVELIAETGNNSIFEGEVNTAISNETANSYIFGGNLSTGLGEITIPEITTTEDFPLLTLLSMIAPSPDWIIAIHNVSLLDTNGEWHDQIDIDLYPYDAGTDSGIDYTSANNNTVPAEPISSLQGITPFSSLPIGSISIVLQEVLNITTPKQLQTTLFPNPAQQDITIAATTPLSSIHIYTVLGTEIVRIENLNTTTTSLNISEFSTGMYLVKIKDSNQNETTQRLIVR